jgi:hypothetical protein
MTFTAQEKCPETDLSINSTPVVLHTGFTARQTFILHVPMAVKIFLIQFNTVTCSEGLWKLEAEFTAVYF